MVIFFGFIMIGAFIGCLITCLWEKNEVNKVNTIATCTVIGAVLGVGASFLGGSFFVKKEIVVEKYLIQPMIFDGKPIVALMEEHDSNYSYDDNYIFQVKDGDKIKLIKYCLSKEEIFFTGDGEERYLEVKRNKACMENMWIWFFYGGTGIIESKAVLKKGDNFLTLPRYSLQSL